MHGCPDLGAPVRLPTQVPRCCRHMIFIVGQIVPGLQPAERAEVIELVMVRPPTPVLPAKYQTFQNRRETAATESWLSHAEWSNSPRRSRVPRRTGLNWAGGKPPRSPQPSSRASQSRSPARSPALTPSTRTLFEVESRRAQTARLPRPSARTAPQTFPASARNSLTRSLCSARSTGPSTLLPRWSVPAA